LLLKYDTLVLTDS